jgi:hypothetical protein
MSSNILSLVVVRSDQWRIATSGLAGADIRRAERASKKPIYMSLRRIAAARARSPARLSAIADSLSP